MRPRTLRPWIKRVADCVMIPLVLVSAWWWSQCGGDDQCRETAAHVIESVGEMPTLTSNGQPVVTVVDRPAWLIVDEWPTQWPTSGPPGR